MQITKPRHAAIVGTVLLAVSGVVRANPSDVDPDAGLAVHGQTMSSELRQRAQFLYESANDAMIGFAKAVNSSRNVRLDGRKIGRTHLQLVQLKRLGERLRMLGEPAGVDYEARANVLRRPLDKLVADYRLTDAGQQFIQSIRIQIQRQAPVRLKTVAKVRQLVAQQKWESAENVLYEMLDLLETGTVFLLAADHRIIYDPIWEVREVVDQTMARKRRLQANEILREARQAQMPDFAGATAQITTAVQALATSAQAPWSGASLTGPQLVEQFGDKWREIHVASLRCQALDWAIGNRQTEEEEYAGGDDHAYSGLAIDEQIDQFKAAVTQAIVQAIDADASRASADEAPALYHQYLNVLAPLVRQSKDRELAAIVEPPLEDLAAKSDAFAQEIAAYRVATEELLRWRGRVAAGRAAAQSSTCPSIEKPFFEATQSDGEYRGLFPETQANPRAPALQASAPQAMSQAVERLMGQSVTTHDVIRLPGQSRAAIARFRMRTYVNEPALDVASESEALKSDLMVDDQTPPLTLAAAGSLISAQRGDFVLVGGTIGGLHLESLITRFATLPPTASILVPLGDLPREETQYHPLSQMVMRFDLQPQWARHDHFYVEFAPPTDVAAAH